MEPEDSIVWISEEELAKQRRIAKDLRKTSWWKKKKVLVFAITVVKNFSRKS
ncbi:hypothetical protein LEP1GSC029_0696 [Leptospira interrogans str. 2002000626]|uniref:Uncharacterized protein n=3 Tax=Leptospira interrogans TaxID=173 RepID=A0A829D7L4_LEPIR|nr:hypothetical protein LEP1GSC158_5434 [Leptospira interrogans serovar Zanoni str. LT2156]EMY05080.1 hypothetical protein LEP1GSC029_0696 [Leptospira interrogans str. 2002000626]EMY25765.1 hypothetical protein LEP1GSC115_0003 [Leptospira interrogans serovar Australis str. 200703203]